MQRCTKTASGWDRVFKTMQVIGDNESVILTRKPEIVSYGMFPIFNFAMRKNYSPFFAELPLGVAFHMENKAIALEP